MNSNMKAQIEDLFARISSPQSRKAADLLFTATPQGFQKAYKPELIVKPRQPQLPVSDSLS